MTLISKHICWHLLRYTGIVTLGLGFIFMLIESLILISLIINNGIDIVTFGSLLLLALPRLLSYTLPIALFIAVLWTFWRLISDNEIVIYRSCGMSDMVLLRAPLVVAGLASCLLYILVLFANPIAKNQLNLLRLSVKSDFVLSLIQPGQFNNLVDGLTLYVSRIDEQFVMHDIFLYDKNTGGSGQTIIASQGRLFEEKDGLRLLVSDGSQQIINDGKLHNLSFEQYSVSIPAGNDKLGNRLVKASERSTLELFSLVFLSSSSVNSLSQWAALQAELHNRLTYPLIAPVLVLLAGYTMLGRGYLSVLRINIASGWRSYLSPKRYPVVMVICIAIGLWFGDFILVNQLKRQPEYWFLLYLFFIVPIGILLGLVRLNSRVR